MFLRTETPLWTCPLHVLMYWCYVTALFHAYIAKWNGNYIKQLANNNNSDPAKLSRSILCVSVCYNNYIPYKVVWYAQYRVVQHIYTIACMCVAACACAVCSLFIYHNHQLAVCVAYLLVTTCNLLWLVSTGLSSHHRYHSYLRWSLSVAECVLPNLSWLSWVLNTVTMRFRHAKFCWHTCYKCHSRKIL